MAPRIEVGLQPSSRTRIIPGEQQRKPPKLSFSFQFWSQRDLFGLSRTSIAWVVEFFERIKELCRFTKEEWEAEVLGNRRGGQRWHYHIVNWDSRKIPIRKSELTWVPSSILDNDDEYPFWQFGLGAGGGRFAGFWESNDRFAIVLLDPHHNLQPSRDFGYKVDECLVHPPSGEIVRLAVDRARRDLPCTEVTCSVHRALAELTVHGDVSGASYFHEVVPVGLDESDQRDLKEILSGGRVKSVHDVFKRGIEVLIEEHIKDL